MVKRGNSPLFCQDWQILSGPRRVPKRPFRTLCKEKFAVPTLTFWALFLSKSHQQRRRHQHARRRLQLHRRRRKRVLRDWLLAPMDTSPWEPRRRVRRQFHRLRAHHQRPLSQNGHFRPLHHLRNSLLLLGFWEPRLLRAPVVTPPPVLLRPLAVSYL